MTTALLVGALFTSAIALVRTRSRLRMAESRVWWQQFALLALRTDRSGSAAPVAHRNGDRSVDQIAARLGYELTAGGGIFQLR